MFPLHKCKKPRPPSQISILPNGEIKSSRGSFKFSVSAISSDPMCSADQLFCNGTIRATSPSLSRPVPLPLPPPSFKRPLATYSGSAVSPKSPRQGYASFCVLEEEESSCPVRASKQDRKCNVKEMFMSRMQRDVTNDEVNDQNEKSGLPPRSKNSSSKNRKMCSDESFENKRKCNFSAHEMPPCTANTLTTELMKKKPFFSYRLACLRSPPPPHHPQKAGLPA